ncbi:MAG: ABC transporter ATP-binding protein [Deltaproteobacteria bacterium]|nr:MAG: ABC transporter ATP-binding protein [Deltaproteobacteria bacterium]
MPEIVLEMENVYKKFRKGEMFDSLRDLIPAMTGKMLRYKNTDQLEKREFWALNDVSFQVRRGEAFGIIGSNGAGKSTILKILSGIMKPTKGQMLVNGTLSALIEVGAGFHQDLTGRENIYLNGTILGMKKDEIARKFDDIVEFSGLGDFIDTPVKRYSSGMYARLGFSVAAHVDPDVLIVDEVLSVGDFLFQKKCTDRMNSVIQSGATVVFVSHNLRAVAELCNRSLLLDRGKTVKIGPTGDVIKYYMGRAIGERKDTTGSEAYISNVRVRNRQGVSTEFTSGEKAWIDVEVTARSGCERLGIMLYAKDDNYYDIFQTSTDRLGLRNVSLDPGKSFLCTYELDLHLGYGTFHFGFAVFQCDTKITYDKLFPACTIFVTPDRDVRGAINLYPKVIMGEMISR